MKLIKYFLQALIIYIFFILIKIIGLDSGRFLFAKIFKKVGPLIKSKETVDSNLDKVFSNSSNKNNIIQGMWSNYGMTFVEYIFLKKFKNKLFKKDIITIKGEEILDSIKSKERPVIFISGHFANFEIMSMEIVRKKINLATVYRPLNNFFLNPFMEYIRKTYVCKNQIKKGISGVRHALNYLKMNYSIALMIDQRVSEGKKVPFFNHGAMTTTLPAQLALKNKIDIIPIYLKRCDDNSFNMEVHEPIQTKYLINSEKNILEITLRLNKILEEMILKDPKQWIWTHNRWK